MLEPIIKRSKSFAEVIRKLGLKQGGGTQANIKKSCQKFDIDFSHFNGRGWNCLGHKDFNKGKEPINVYFKRYTNRKPANVKKRILTYGLKDYQCESCGISHKKGWLGEDITIELHHIDGDRCNNYLDNLKFLCPNCHSQTDNYRNKKRAS